MEDKITWPFEQVIAARNRQDFRKIWSFQQNISKIKQRLNTIMNLFLTF